jgi:uncharacterized membrane protein
MREWDSEIREWLGMFSAGIELIAVAIIVFSVLIAALVAFKLFFLVRAPSHVIYLDFRNRLARALLIGLEILVAADIIRTVALDLTIASVLSLGLLVLIRTLLSWALIVEVEGVWPWRVASLPDPKT